MLIDFVNLFLAILGTIVVVFAMIGVWVILKMIVPILFFSTGVWIIMEFLK
jgi:hypothetical protein